MHDNGVAYLHSVEDKGRNVAWTSSAFERANYRLVLTLASDTDNRRPTIKLDRRYRRHHASALNSEASAPNRTRWWGQVC